MARVALADCKMLLRDILVEIRVAPYLPANASEVRAFNDRLCAQGQTEFLLPPEAPEQTPPGSQIRDSYFLALEGTVVRGGFRLVRFPAWLGFGEEIEALNCREPLSEGIINPKYSFVALKLLKEMQKQGPYLFAMGMGGGQARFARFLKGAGWTVELVPFLFRVIRVGPFLSELRLLQSSRIKRMFSRAARFTGVGKLGVSLLQAKSIIAGCRLRGATIENVTEWGTWADELWEHFRQRCSFCVKRDRVTLMHLYQIGKDRTEAFLVRREGKPVGWVAVLRSKMSGHKYFGNLQVATILDGIAYPDAMDATVTLAARRLAADGADLIVTNQQYAPWVRAFRNAGFLSAKSNYVLATSKALSEAIARQPEGRERIHFTRGDGDGRIHL
jgi:hypothetical protein